MSLLPLVFATICLLLPTVLHRWEQVGVSPHIPPKEWARGLWSVVLALILSFVGALCALSVGRGNLASAIPLAVIVLLLFPWHLTRYVLIPLGRWRGAWHLAQVAGWAWRGDVPGGQLVAGAWAVLRQRRPSPSAIAFLTAQRDVLEPLGATGVLASALLADAVGDREQARRFMAMVANFDEPHRPPLARFLANEWRVADAAERGSWAEVEQLGRSPHRRSRGTMLLGALAARMIGYPPVPHDAWLVALWLVAPARLRTLPLLRRALATPRLEATPSSRRPLAEAGPSTLRGSALLAAHTDALAAERVSFDQLCVLARSWDAMLDDPKLRSQTAHRAIALRAGDPDAALHRMARQVESDLSTLARTTEATLAELEGAGNSLRRVARELRHELLDELAIRSETVEARVHARRALPPLDELREFLAVRQQYERVCQIGGPELVRVAFSQVHDPLCNLAVWLWDERGELAIASAMFSWLGHEATIAGDEEAAELQRRNVACGR